MLRLIFVTTAILSLLAMASCKKDSNCTDINAYAANIYIMRDSIVYLHDSTAIVNDTISFNPISNSGGKCFINGFGPQNIGLVATGCAGALNIDTISYGNGQGIFGKGSITNNGGNINLTVTQIPIYFPGDTVLYYCKGVKQ